MFFLEEGKNGRFLTPFFGFFWFFWGWLFWSFLGGGPGVKKGGIFWVFLGVPGVGEGGPREGEGGSPGALRGA